VSPADKAAQIPDELEKLVDQPRVLVRRGGAPRKDGICVVYWMQRAMRIVDNSALNVAIEAANVLGLPVVVYFQVIPNYPNANLRHYRFLQQGLRDVAEDAAARELTFIVRRSPARLEEFLEEVKAALLIGDENPCREPERWRRALARRLRIPYWTVDADVVVPSRVFGRSFVLLHHFRPRLKAELPKYLGTPVNEPPYPHWSAFLWRMTLPKGSQNSIAPSARWTALSGERTPRSDVSESLSTTSSRTTRRPAITRRRGEPAACRPICTSAISDRSPLRGQ
jgi:deoxyribodipyrimidine photo-lyase